MFRATNLDRKKGVSLWRQIQEDLKARISRGEIEPGAQLPTEMELSRAFGVNRHTVRRAMKALEDEGLIRVEHGRGAFVQEQVIHYPLGRRTRFSEIVSRQSRIPSGKIISSKEIQADAVVASALGIEKGSPVLCLETANEADGRVIGICSHHFPLPRFKDLIGLYRNTGSITESLKQMGVHDYTRLETRVTARVATARDARHLSQPKSKPVLVTEAVNVDQNGRPIEYGLTRCASDWVTLVVKS